MKRLLEKQRKRNKVNNNISNYCNYNSYKNQEKNNKFSGTLNGKKKDKAQNTAEGEGSLKDKPQHEADTCYRGREPPPRS